MANAASTRIEGLTPGDGCVHSDGKLFNLTPRILDLDFAYLSSLPIWNLAKPVMQSLALQVQESCSAAVLDSYDIVCVLRVSTHKIMSISLDTSSHLPVYCTSNPLHRDEPCGAGGQNCSSSSSGLVSGEPGTSRRPGVNGSACLRQCWKNDSCVQCQRSGQPHQCQNHARDDVAAAVAAGSCAVSVAAIGLCARRRQTGSCTALKHRVTICENLRPARSHPTQ